MLHHPGGGAQVVHHPGGEPIGCTTFQNSMNSAFCVPGSFTSLALASLVEAASRAASVSMAARGCRCLGRRSQGRRRRRRRRSQLRQWPRRVILQNRTTAWPADLGQCQQQLLPCQRHFAMKTSCWRRPRVSWRGSAARAAPLRRALPRTPTAALAAAALAAAALALPAWPCSGHSRSQGLHTGHVPNTHRSLYISNRDASLNLAIALRARCCSPRNRLRWFLVWPHIQSKMLTFSSGRSMMTSRKLKWKCWSTQLCLTQSVMADATAIGKPDGN